MAVRMWGLGWRVVRSEAALALSWACFTRRSVCSGVVRPGKGGAGREKLDSFAGWG